MILPVLYSWMNLNLRECTQVPQWIQYPEILLGERYNSIRALADSFVTLKNSNKLFGVVAGERQLHYFWTQFVLISFPFL